MRKLLIFDWGRTLYDPETKNVFPGAQTILRELRSRYELAIVSLATDGDTERRFNAIRGAGIENFFSRILVAKEGKGELYEQALRELKYSPEHAIIIDDRTVRGIRWGNLNGATTIWVKRGKFSEEIPTEDTGQPDYTVLEIGEILAIL